MLENYHATVKSFKSWTRHSASQLQAAIWYNYKTITFCHPCCVWTVLALQSTDTRDWMRNAYTVSDPESVTFFFPTHKQDVSLLSSVSSWLLRSMMSSVTPSDIFPRRWLTPSCRGRLGGACTDMHGHTPECRGASVGSHADEFFCPLVLPTATV